MPAGLYRGGAGNRRKGGGAGGRRGCAEYLSAPAQCWGGYPPSWAALARPLLDGALRGSVSTRPPQVWRLQESAHSLSDSVRGVPGRKSDMGQMQEGVI